MIDVNKQEIADLFKRTKEDGYEQTKNGVLHWLASCLSLNADSFESLEDAEITSFSIAEKLLFLSSITEQDALEIFDSPDAIDVICANHSYLQIIQ